MYSFHFSGSLRKVVKELTPSNLGFMTEWVHFGEQYSVVPTIIDVMVKGDNIYDDV